MENKQKAAANRDQTFEELLLETGRLIDEIGREEEDFERLESFGELITLFDRIDHTTTLVNKLAFMDDVELSQEQVRSLFGNMQVFEKLRRGLFQLLFIDPIVANEYALAYGKKKLYALTLGLISIENNEASIADVAQSIATLNRNERAYFAVYSLARRRMANFYLELNTAEGRETFRREIKAEITHDAELRTAGRHHRVAARRGDHEDPPRGVLHQSAPAADHRRAGRAAAERLPLQLADSTAFRSRSWRASTSRCAPFRRNCSRRFADAS